MFISFTLVPSAIDRVRRRICTVISKAERAFGAEPAFGRSLLWAFTMPDNSELESEPNSNEDEAVERARINSETAKIAWQDLQRFFAQGHAIYVAPDLDLIDVAWEISRDRKKQLEVWMADAKVGQVSDPQAVQWLEGNALMWCVVVRPWVLVQPLPAASPD